MGIRVLIFLSTFISKKTLFRIGRWIVKRRFSKNIEKNLRIEKNLQTAFPNISIEQIESTRREYKEHVADMSVEMLLSLTGRFEMSENVIEFSKKTEQLRDVVGSYPRGTILLTAHYGNWELLGMFAGESRVPMTIVRKTMRNPLIYQKLITPFREKYGHTEYEREGALSGLVKTLKGNGVAGLLVDEMIPPPNGIAVEFFGKPAYTLKSIAQLSLKYDAQVVPVFIERVDSGKFQIDIQSRVEYDLSKCIGNEDKINIMTREYNRILENRIIANPSQWQWVYNRWRSPVNREIS